MVKWSKSRPLQCAQNDVQCEVLNVLCIMHFMARSMTFQSLILRADERMIQSPFIRWKKETLTTVKTEMRTPPK